MDLKREPIRRADPARYPSLDEVRTDRRRFLQVLGGSVAALGLAACESALEPIPNVDTGGVTSDAALPDVTEAPDVPPDTGEPPLAGGMAEPDIRQPPPDVQVPRPDTGLEPPLGGEPPIPDVVEPPPDTGEPPLAGDMPAPDVVQPPPDVQAPPPDTGEPPLAGDLPWPAPDVVQPGPDVGADVGPDVGPDVGEEPPIDGDLPAPWEP